MAIIAVIKRALHDRAALRVWYGMRKGKNAFLIKLA